MSLRKERIGTTLTIIWEVLTNGDAVSLENRDIRVFIIDPRNKRTEMTDLTITGAAMDVVQFVFQGKDQVHPGVYRLECYENYGHDNQAPLDDDVIMLVPRSKQRTGGTDGLITTTLELTTGTLWIGVKGDTGKSAYELAVDNGYEGTETEWLASLHGQDADVAAAEAATTAANNAATAANDAASSANSSATAATNAASAANTAATNATNAATATNTAASNATTQLATQQTQFESQMSTQQSTFEAQEATRNAANQAALDAAETLTELGAKLVNTAQTDATSSMHTANLSVSQAFAAGHYVSLTNVSKVYVKGYAPYASNGIAAFVDDEGTSIQVIYRSAATLTEDGYYEVTINKADFPSGATNVIGFCYPTTNNPNYVFTIWTETDRLDSIEEDISNNAADIVNLQNGLTDMEDSAYVVETVTWTSNVRTSDLNYANAFSNNQYASLDNVERIYIKSYVPYAQNGIIQFMDSEGALISSVARSAATATSDGYYEATIEKADFPSGATIFAAFSLSPSSYPNYACTYTTKQKSSDLVKSVLKESKASGIHLFSVDVNIGFSNDENTTDCQAGATTAKAYCAVRLPQNYDANGEPYTLVITHHGAGSNVFEDSAPDLTGIVSTYLCDELGYVVLEVSGLPEGVWQSWMSDESYGIQFGNQYLVDNTNKAYGYVIDNFNVRKDGCFIIGTSMGGLSVNNTINNTDIPVLAVALNAPVIDPYLDAWNSAWNSYNTQTMAYLFNFDNFKVENDVPYFSIDGGTTWIAFTDATQAQKNVYFYQNLGKMKGFNPPYNKRFYANPDGAACSTPETPTESSTGVTNGTTTFDYTHYGVEYKAPLKIWHSENDGTNYIHLAQNFVKLVQNGGQYAEMRVCPEGTRHGVWGNTNMSEAAIITSAGGLTISVYCYELGLWLQKWKRK